MTDPGPGPDVGAELEDGERHHEVDAGGELDPAGQAVEQTPGEVQQVGGAPVATPPHSCNTTLRQTVKIQLKKIKKKRS